MAAIWLVKQNSEQCGPYSWDELMTYAAEGSIEPGAELWTEGMADWVRADSLQGLFPHQPSEPLDPADTDAMAGPKGAEGIAAKSGGKSILLPAVIVCGALLFLAVGGVFAFGALMGSSGSVEALENPEAGEEMEELALLPLDEMEADDTAPDPENEEAGAGEEEEPANGNDEDDTGSAGGNDGASTNPGGSNPGGSSTAPGEGGSPGGNNPGGSGNDNAHDPASPATVNLNTSPRGAQVLVNGTYVGNTPHTLQLRPGSHIITFRLAGYHDINGRITVESGGSYFLTESLVPRQNDAPPEDEDDPEDPQPEPPLASFTFNPDAPRAGDSVTFDAGASSSANGNIALYHWSFGDPQDSEADAESTSFTYQDAGTYTVTLRVWDSAGESAETSSEVTVLAPEPQLDPPVASFTVSTDSPLESEEILFNASASSSINGPIEEYSWHFGDQGGTIVATADNTYEFAYRDWGTYTVTLRVTDSAGQSGEYAKEINVQAPEPEVFPPHAEFTVDPIHPLTFKPALFDASASRSINADIVRYQWHWEDGTSTETTLPTVEKTFFQARTYTVTLRVKDSNGLMTDFVQEIAVASAPPDCGDDLGDGSIAWRGGIYRGETENGMPHGEGYWEHHDGRGYHGEFSEGEFHGEGVMSYPDGRRVHAIWSRGEVREVINEYYL